MRRGGHGLGGANSERMGEFWGYPASRAFAELLIDCEEDRVRTGLMIECVGAGPALPGTAWTIGNTIINQAGDGLDPDVLAHETKPADQ
jgi:hypothetical protein